MDNGAARSWKFWAGGPGKNVVCGVLSASCDTINRSFPLMMIGTGPMAQWETHWDLLPFACEAAWSKAEHICAKPLKDLKQMKRELTGIKSISEDWPRYRKQRTALADNAMFSGRSGLSGNYLGKLNHLEGFARRDRFTLFLGEFGSDSLMSFYSYENTLTLLKKRDCQPPTMVFWGGTPRASSIMVVKRPLSAEDFKQLWTLHRETP